ncbi:MAG: Hsp20/alpha crystallin family protein [Planctomycetota bacterium]
MTTPNDSGHLKGRAAVDGILGGLGDIFGKLADLADNAERLQQGQGSTRDGSFQTSDGREGRFQVGFNVRTLADNAGERTIEVEPFGDVTRDRTTGEASVTERREPPTDIFEEPDHVLVVVEMPGIALDQATLTVEGDVLTVTAENGPKRYYKEVLLPGPFKPADLNITATNGVFEVRLDASEPEAA